RAAALRLEALPGAASPPGAGPAALREFLAERWRGLHPILWGDQLRQARLDEQIYLGLLQVEESSGVSRQSSGAGSVAQDALSVSLPGAGSETSD
ncbi:MAG TPA: hypothetical protein VGE07_19400, partial [Herpetosiphonaceae bacterium]